MRNMKKYRVSKSKKIKKNKDKREARRKSVIYLCCLHARHCSRTEEAEDVIAHMFYDEHRRICPLRTTRDKRDTVIATLILMNRG